MILRGIGRRRAMLLLIVALGLAARGAFASARAGDIADWYADVAARHLPERLSSYAITETELGAFFFCARQVAREMDGELSVETFPSPADGRVQQLGEGRYRVTAHVDEARADGQRVQHQFACTVRYDSGRWRLEDLVIG